MVKSSQNFKHLSLFFSMRVPMQNKHQMEENKHPHFHLLSSWYAFIYLWYNNFWIIIYPLLSIQFFIPYLLYSIQFIKQ